MTCLENVVVNQFFMIFFLDVEVVVDNEFIAFVFPSVFYALSAFVFTSFQILNIFNILLVFESMKFL